MVDSQISHGEPLPAEERAIIISYPASASGIIVWYIVLLKTPPKYRKFNLSKETTPQKITRTLTIFSGTWYEISWPMMAKPMKTLELHYPMKWLVIYPYTTMDRPMKLFNFVIPIKPTPSIKRTLTLVPKFTCYISLYNEPLFSRHLY